MNVPSTNQYTLKRYRFYVLIYKNIVATINQQVRNAYIYIILCIQYNVAINDVRNNVNVFKQITPYNYKYLY